MKSPYKMNQVFRSKESSKYYDKKGYTNYFANQQLRRENPNIRQIVKGKPTAFRGKDESNKEESSVPVLNN